MNTIIGWIADHAGLNKAWDFMDGKKTYAAAGLGILTSLSGLGVEVAPLLAAHNTAGLIGFIQGLPHDASWLSLMASVGLLGLGHKADKAAATVAAPGPALPPAPAP